MTDETLRQADRFFADGDYVRALDELQKIAPFDPDITRRIHSALERMKLVAAREFAVGRWSVAEGIFDAVQENARFLTSTERDECRLLVDEIGRCRDREKSVQAIVQAAAALAAQSQFAQSREVALQGMRSCDDPHLVARLRRLLGGLPHPLGRLLYGFDSALEVEQFVRAKSGATAEMILDESHAMGGGFLRIRFPSKGSGISLLDPPPDWSDDRELGLCVRLESRVRAGFLVMVGDLQNSWSCEMKILDPYWNQRRFPLESFRSQGAANWSGVTCLAIVSLSDEPAELFLDEVRLKAKSPGR